jgi:hypothetical protein
VAQPVLLAALGVAALIAVTFLVLFGASAGNSDEVDAGSAAPGGAIPLDGAGLPERVTLTIALQGSGGGKVRVTPGDMTCARSCEHRFDSGTRVTLIATAGPKSTFDGWEDACAGSARCSIVMQGDQAVTATFERRPVAPKCDEGAKPPAPDCPDADLGAAGDDLDPADEDLDPALAGDCADGRDNDGDGLTDDAQDPDCASGGTEAGAPAAPPPPPPPPARAAGDCGDGRDNDGDGQTDSAQDPDCLTGSSESGKPSTGGTRPTTRAPSQCRDGKDNDGDGLIDKAQDPGCEHDSTEAD